MAKKKSEPTGDPRIDKALEALAGGKTLSAANQQVLRGLGESVIDRFMTAVGIENPSGFTDKNGWRHLELESAKGVAGIRESDGELYLHVEAVVMSLPSDKDVIQALMRHALEFNCTLPGECRLGIQGTRVVASATENMRRLRSPEEFGQLIQMVLALANTIDDAMKEKFGGTSKKRGAVPVADST